MVMVSYENVNWFANANISLKQRVLWNLEPWVANNIEDWQIV